MDHGSTEKRCAQIVTLNTNHILHERHSLSILPNEQFYRNFFLQPTTKPKHLQQLSIGE